MCIREPSLQQHPASSFQKSPKADVLARTIHINSELIILLGDITTDLRTLGGMSVPPSLSIVSDTMESVLIIITLEK